MKTPAKLSIKQSYTIVVRNMRQAIRMRPYIIALFFTGALMEIGATIGSIYATAQLGSRLASFVNSGVTDYIWYWLVLDILAGLFIIFGFTLMNYSKRIMYFSFVGWATNYYLSSLCRLDIADFYDETIRNKINKVQASYTWQMSQLSDASLDLIYGILRFIAITLVVAQITWWLIPIIALFLLPSLIVEKNLAQLVWFVWDEKGDQRHTFWGLENVIRQVKGQMELRSTQAGDYVLDRINSMNKIFYTLQEKKYRKANNTVIGTKILETLGTAIGAVVVLRQFLAGIISLERYFFLSGALLRVGGSLNAIFGTLSRLQDPLLYAADFYSLTDSTPKNVDIVDAVKLTSKQSPEIVFENVSFTYPGQDNPVFTNLNLTISSGEHVALVGENGSGKSTLIKLLLRYYPPESGRILINGIDLQKININTWYEQIATLFQNFNEYPLSIAENITIGRSNKPVDKKLQKEAARFSSVDTMVAKYTYGWDTVLDSTFKKGVEPSGGQWQKVALARAFYRQANLLILDEPTSAIDANAEYEIFNNIFEQYKERTALIVSHRFSTVRRANRIIVLESGSIIEQGSHSELMKNKKLYYTLFNNQAKGYRD